ncbi:HNH endonuclease [Agrobacterium bohemicum]|nr:HNH endonuclease signature motif containing protein [Agrobacterium bohemicum]
MRTFPANRAVVLKNIRCVYCGEMLSGLNRTKDHVIGRRFVPKGKFNAQFNLIVNACRACNNKKADLEDDIAAITLAPDVTGRHSHDDLPAIEEARRRAENSISRRTRKPISQSRETVNLNGSLGPGINLKIAFTSPPQIELPRAFELARLQLMAFFYLQTYKTESQVGGYWLHGYHPVQMVRWEDWGNAVMRQLMTEINDWDFRFHCITADGFFKAMTRKHPTAETWVWALEWNRSHRLIGFFGERDPAQAIVDKCRMTRPVTIFEQPNQSLHYRVETPLSGDDDTLFDWTEKVAT